MTSPVWERAEFRTALRPKFGTTVCKIFSCSPARSPYSGEGCRPRRTPLSSSPGLFVVGRGTLGIRASIML